MMYSSEMVNLITKLKLIELKINYLNKHEKKLNSKIELSFVFTLGFINNLLYTSDLPTTIIII